MITPPAALEALLFSAGEPLPKKRLAELLTISEDQLVTVIEALERSLSGRGVALVETETDVELRTAAEASDMVKRMREGELARDLGKGSLETLSIIAYGTEGAESADARGADKGGTARGEIDWVRGVNSSASLRTLLMRGLIEGKEDPSDKRRVRYALTTEALAYLGITRTADLPRFGELHGTTRTALAEKESAPASSPTE